MRSNPGRGDGREGFARMLIRAVGAWGRGGGLLLLLVALLGCHGAAPLRQAERLLAEGDPLAARQLLLGSDDPRALLALADLEERLFPHHHTRGLRALSSGDPLAATHAFEQALAISPGHAEVERLLEVALRRAREQRDRLADLSDALEVRDWRAALVAVATLPPSTLGPASRILLVDQPREVAPEIRRRLFARLELEVLSADREGDLDALASWVHEAESALLMRAPGEDTIDRALLDVSGEWRTILHARLAAREHRREAEAGLREGERLESWRSLRLALLRDPEDEELRESESCLRRTFRERVLLAIDRASRLCDLEAARLALLWIDELGEAWPAEATAERAELEEWIAEEQDRKAWRLEAEGHLGHALLARVEAAELAPTTSRGEALAAVIERIEARPRLEVVEDRIGGDRTPYGRLEVVLGPLRVTERIERSRIAERAGWVRTGTRSAPRPGAGTDARRLLSVLNDTVELRDAWLGMPPTRAGLGERRLRFQVAELRRLVDRIERRAGTEELGVWREQRVEWIHEECRLVVERSVLLLRDGELIGERTLFAEGSSAGRLPHATEEAAAKEAPIADLEPVAGLPPGVLPLATGVASSERLILELEAECRQRTVECLDRLRRAEVDRLEWVALERARRGDREGAIEGLVTSWLQTDREDPGSRARRRILIGAWTGQVLRPLDRTEAGVPGS